MKIQYVWPTHDQNRTLQLGALAAAGPERDKVFQEQVSGASVKRPGLDDALAALHGVTQRLVGRLAPCSRATGAPSASSRATRP